MICVFLSTLSLRRATVVQLSVSDACIYFYPRSPCGERHIEEVKITIFDISIHALLAESDPSTTRRLTNLMISIHALLAESDAGAVILILYPAKISIHALLAESDALIRYLINTYHNFYPRSPCGERRCRTWGTLMLYNFYPRSPCGERPVHQ